MMEVDDELFEPEPRDVLGDISNKRFSKEGNSRLRSIDRQRE
jgi:hypothetical protein